LSRLDSTLVTVVVDEQTLRNLKKKTYVNSERNIDIEDNIRSALTTLEDNFLDRFAEELLCFLTRITKPHFFGALGRPTYDRPRKSFWVALDGESNTIWQIVLVPEKPARQSTQTQASLFHL
jgi:hypothetical protein